MTQHDNNKKILEIPIDLLDDNPKNNYIFGIDREELESLVISIRALGVLQPLIVEKKEDGRYLIHAGHRRKYASIEAGLKTVPCQEISGDIDSDLVLAETNLNFRKLSPMNIAKAIRLEMDALGISHGGDRKSVNKKSSHNRCILIEKFKMSKNSLYLYDKLNDLIPELQAMVEAGNIGLTLGARLAGLDPGIQKELFEYLGDAIKDIGPEDIKRLREQNDRGYLVLEVMQKNLNDLESEFEKRRKKEGDIADLERRIQALRAKKKELEYDLSDYANAATRAREQILNNGAALLGVVEELVRPIAGARPKIETLLELPLEPATATHLVKWAQVLVEVGQKLEAAAKKAMVIQGGKSSEDKPKNSRLKPVKKPKGGI